MNDETDIASLKRKTDQLNKEAWEGRVNDSNRSLLLSEEALGIAETIDYTRGKAEGLRTSGFCLMRLSKNAESKARLEESLQLFKSLNDLAGEGYIYTGLGIIQRNFGDNKTSLEWLYKSLELVKLTNYYEIEPLVYYHIGITNKYMGNLEQALEYLLKSLSTGKEINNWIAEAYTLNTLGSIYEELRDYTNALEYHRQSLFIRQKSGDKWGEAGSLDNIGNIYFTQGDLKNAMAFCEQSLFITRSVGDKKGEANSLFHLAEINYALKDYTPAQDNAKQCLEIREAIGDKKGQAEIYLCMADISRPAKSEKEKSQEQLEFLNRALVLGNETGAQDMLLKIHSSFYKVFKKQQDHKKALEHLELSNTIEKEIHSKSFNQKILNLEITHKIEQSKKEAEIYRLRNVELAELFEESKRQKEAIQTTLTELKAAQTQLIQSEKMASLGELTAGIAHEIQNPLNFVNNFSEVNIELIEELKGERQKVEGERNTQLEDELLNDLSINLEKINHHGKRADAIVKGMLQHSRSSTGIKEPTDINALADEYLRLSYHGLRAKDKSFNATMKTDFDESIGKINIVPQEIGRVILNLISNAFYVVDEKKKAPQPSRNEFGTGSEGGVPYESTVSVSTKKMGDKVEIKVSDNGNGIPQKVLDKIFQPFFTTKPTGQGTGLGLSLSYDIVKAHGGEIKVNTRENEGTEFTISLPA